MRSEAEIKDYLLHLENELEMEISVLKSDDYLCSYTDREHIRNALRDEIKTLKWILS